MIRPSHWVEVHLDQIPCSGRVLDLACGRGRHSRLLAERGYSVLAVDRNALALAELEGVPGVSARCLDLEQQDWPLAGESFAGIVVTNYLWRPHLPSVLDALQPGGVLIYETFMAGQEAYGKPSNPDFLLRPGELKTLAEAAGLRVFAFWQGVDDEPETAARQRICARRPA